VTARRGPAPQTPTLRSTHPAAYHNDLYEATAVVSTAPHVEGRTRRWTDDDRRRWHAGARGADEAWADFWHAAVNLTVAGRSTRWRASGAAWAVDQLRAWVEALDVDALDALADDVEHEAAGIAARTRTRVERVANVGAAA